MKQFKIVKFIFQVEFPYLSKNYYITAFISGLREDIKPLVISQHHNNLFGAFQYAKYGCNV
jgi:hypothetical protein